jgi:predicted AlkP superfamily pyrophosphatase or phosphodiesterase
VREHDQVLAAGGDPGAFLALDAAEGTYFGWGLTSFETSATSRGTHGFDPERPDMQASLLMYGAGIAPGVLENARLIDVAPTIAQWLGVSMPDVDGRVLH